MLTAAKEGTFSASSDPCVFFPLAASEGVPKNSRLEFARKNPAPHQGSAWSNSGKALGIEEVVWENCGRSDDSARYYDSPSGKFASEDPIKFAGGNNFYRYTMNSPATLADPRGLSPDDVQQMKAACEAAVDDLVVEGRRVPSGPGGLGDFSWATLLRRVPFGWMNDFEYWFSPKRDSCRGQAEFALPYLRAPKYQDPWAVSLVPIWHGTHYVVQAYPLKNPSDPIVMCDPWLDRFWTIPNPKQPK
jgi:RHS repeat-associated protein